MSARPLLTKTELARKANADPRTIDRLLSNLGIEPEAVTGKHALFNPEVARQLRRELYASTPEVVA